MPDIGIRELKARASEIVRTVREKRARYVVTHRGRPVAILMPLESTEAPAPAHTIQNENSGSAWEELKRLGEEIGREWQSEKSAVEILSETRR
ncbi:MAG: type II toxin-antitoxin system Phd/YefM family antitoxin [Anaerolineales bacterium]|nr:type II toxin-antitoxin system Phd/YefM family antitoxin [Anaerolineales bacterium]